MGNKFAVKPVSGGVAPFYDIVMADPQGIARPMPQLQMQGIRDTINSFAPDQYPTGGLVFIPQNQWVQMQRELATRGTLWGQRVSNSPGSEERFGGVNAMMGGSRLGDGFTVPSIHRTYVNAGILGNPNHLQEILAHELGHHAAEWDDPRHSDPSEYAADQFKKAYLQRGHQTQALWNAVNQLPLQNPFLQSGPVMPLAPVPQVAANPLLVPYSR